MTQLSQNDPAQDAGHSSPFWDRHWHSGTGGHTPSCGREHLEINSMCLVRMCVLLCSQMYKSTDGNNNMIVAAVVMEGFLFVK